MNTANTVELPHHAFGRGLPGGEPGLVDLGGAPPSEAEARRAERAALGAVEGADPSVPVRVLRTLPNGRCLYARAFPATPDVFGRPTRRFHFVWLARDELRALGNLPWRLDPQLPDLGRIEAPLGPLAVCLEAMPGSLAAPPEQWCDAVAAVEQLRTGGALVFPVAGDLRFALVWLAAVALGLPDVTLNITPREAAFVAPRPVPAPEPPSDSGAARWGRFVLAAALALGSLAASAAAGGLFARFAPTVPPVGLATAG